MVAVHVPLILYSGLLLTETSFTFLLLLGVWCWMRFTRATDEQATGWPWAVASGLALGGACAVRANLFLALPGLAALLWLIFLGWIIHLWSILSAALYEPPRRGRYYHESW